jgi:hypothetical protein
MIEVIRSSETSVLRNATKRHMSEVSILHIHRRENLSLIGVPMFKFTSPFQRENRRINKYGRCKI